MQPHIDQDLEQTLDRHGGFVRRLAGSLVFDENRAEDVAQQTWLAAVQHPPRDTATVRGWLARVVRNFSFRMRRDDARRTAREALVARPEAQTSSRDTPAQAAMLREVIDAVLALDEPYRSTVLMRFYENLEPAEIAIRTGVPAGTVRTRLKRGLDQLRDRFDAAHDGNRRAWSAMLLPVALGSLKPALIAASAAAGGAVAAASPAFSGITLGGVLMAKKVGIICGLAAVAVVSVVIATRSHGDTPEPIGPEPAIRIAETAALPPPIEAPKPAEGPITAKPYVPTDEDRATPEIVLAEKGAPSATVVGRVVDQQGTPQANVPVTLKTVVMITEDEASSPAEISTERQLQAKTGVDGRFSFAQIPVNVEARVRARPETLCDASRPASITKAGVLDIGDLVAVPGGSIAGVVLGPQGTPVKGCKVSASSINRVSGSAIGFVTFRSVLEPDTRSATTNAAGQYRIDGLAEGTCSAVATADEFPSEPREDVKVRTGEVTWETDFKLTQGATLAGIVRDAEGRPIPGATVVSNPSELRLDPLESRVPERAKKTTTGADGRFLLQGLRSEATNVKARKSGFVGASQRNVTPGGEVAFTLQPCGFLFGTVRSAADNAPVTAEFSIRVEDDPIAENPVKPRVLKGAEAANALQVPETPGLFAITDLPAAPVRLFVRAPNFANAEIGPVRAPPGDKLEVSVLLTPQAVIRGIVVDSAGNPIEGARVSLGNAKAAEAAAPGEAVRFKQRRVVRHGDSPAAVADMDVSRSAVTDASGAFSIPSLPGGDYRLSASHRKFAPSAPQDVAVKNGGIADGVRLVLEVGGTFAGSVRDADGNTIAGASVALARRSAPQSHRFFGGNRQNGVTNADGEFEITGISPGEYLASFEEGHADAAIQIAFARNEDAEEEGVPVSIEAGKTTRKDLQQKARASVSGVVKEGGKPAPNIRVSLGQKGMPAFLNQTSTKTDENGAFAFDKVAPGDYSVIVDPPGAAIPIKRAVALAPRADQRLTIELPTGAIEGRVTDATTKKPVSGVTITAALEEGATGEKAEVRGMMVAATLDDEGGAVQTISIGGPSEAIRTDSDGNFRIRYLPPGKYRVTIKGASVMPQSRSDVVVEEGRTTKDVDFGTVKGATLIVSIDPAGHDVTNLFGFIEIQDVPESHQVAGGTVKSGIKFTGLKPGRYHVRVDAPMNELDGQIDVDVPAGEETRVTVRLSEQ